MFKCIVGLKILIISITSSHAANKQAIESYLNGSRYDKNFETEYYIYNRCNAAYATMAAVFEKQGNNAMYLKVKRLAKVITTKALFIYFKKNKQKIPTDINDPVLKKVQANMLKIQKDWITFYSNKENLSSENGKYFVKGIALKDIKFCNQIK